MGKYTLIIVAGFVVTFGWIKGNLNQVSGRFVDSFLEYHERATARLTANSLAHMSLVALADSSAWRAGYTSISLGDGTGWATLADNTTDTTLSAGQVRITVGASSGDAADTVEVLVAITGSVPPGVHGGITANTTLGAVIALSATPSGNCIGNGSGEILYSSEALQQASSTSDPGSSGGMTVVSWLE